MYSVDDTDPTPTILYASKDDKAVRENAWLAEPANKRLHNLRYIKKVADIPADASVEQSHKDGSTMEFSTTKYNISQVYQLVKQYDKDSNYDYAISDTVASEVCNSVLSYIDERRQQKQKSTAVLDAPLVSTPDYRTTISIPDLLELVNNYFPDVLLKANFIEKSTLSRAFFWRREGDSNPRDAINAYTISNRAP